MRYVQAKEVVKPQFLKGSQVKNMQQETTYNPQALRKFSFLRKFCFPWKNALPPARI